MLVNVSMIYSHKIVIGKMFVLGRSTRLKLGLGLSYHEDLKNWIHSDNTVVFVTLNKVIEGTTF